MEKGMRVVASGSVLTGGTLEEALGLVAELGYRELDLLLITGWAHVGLDDLADDYDGVSRRIKNALSASGLEASSFNTKYSVKLEDENGAAQRRRELDALLRLMGDLGVKRASLQPTLTGDAGYLEKAFLPTIAEAWKQQDYAAKSGFLLSLEPHVMSCVCTNAALKEARRIYPGLCFVADPSHLIHSGEPMDSLDYLFEQATMVHFRDARKGDLFVPYGKGLLDAGAAVGALKRAGYDGPISLEYLTDKRDEFIYADMERFGAAVESLLN